MEKQTRHVGVSSKEAVVDITANTSIHAQLRRSNSSAFERELQIGLETTLLVG